MRFAIATEESLRETARKYSELGYRYKRQEWEAADNLERLSVWLRWVNPDDGWQFGDFADSEALCRSLRLLFDRSQGNEFEEFCTDAVLAPLSRDSAWSGDPLSRSLIVGFTYGENPLDFLRSATRANPYPRVMELWRQHWESQNLGHRIKRRS